MEKHVSVPLHVDWRRTLTATVLAAALSAPAWSAESGWQGELTRQIRAQHECVVAFFSQVFERKREGDRTLFAKVHCEDKRTFDASRHRDGDLFEIKQCAPPDERAC